MKDLLDAVGAVIDTAELRAALALWDDPTWTVAVIGRRSAGKTTRINAWTGSNRPVGLGGVTTAVERVGDYVDTPGIEDADEAADVLEPVLGSVDEVVWVVDGLQPVTDVERRVLAEVLPPGTALQIVVSRLDLVDPAERDDVLARVRAVTRPFRPEAVRDERLRPDPRRSLRRRLALNAAIDRTLARIDALPPAPEPDALGRTLQQRWRAAVRDAEERVKHRVEGDRFATPAVALAALARAAEAAVADLLAEVAHLAPGTPAPRLPLPRGWRSLGDGLGGASAAMSALRAAAGSWLLEGQAALQDWLDDSVAAGLGDEYAKRERARELLRDYPPSTTAKKMPTQ